MRRDRPNSPLDSARQERLDVLAGTRGADQDEALRREELDAAMSELFGSILRRRVYHRSATLGADVPLAVNGQWYSGPFIGLDRGVWLVHAVAQFRNDAAAVANQLAARILDGSTGLSTAETSIAATSGEARQLTMFCPVVITTSRILTLQAAAQTGNANLRLKAAAPFAGAETVATRIMALRMGDE